MWTVLNSSGKRISPIFDRPVDAERYINNMLGGSKYAVIWEIK